MFCYSDAWVFPSPLRGTGKTGSTLMEEANWVANIDWAKYAPAIISTTGALVGVVIGAGLTYWFERKAERDRRDRRAAEDVIYKLSTLSSLLFEVFVPEITNPPLHEGEKLYAETLVELARSIERASSGFSDTDEIREISTMLRQKHDTRIDILTNLTDKYKNLSVEYFPAISGVQERMAEETVTGPGSAVTLVGADDDNAQWPGIAYKEFAIAIHERTGLPLRGVDIKSAATS
jgi:hypothetical protein